MRDFYYLILWNMVEKEGFEPSLRYERKHAFQACALNHSTIFPKCKNLLYIFFNKSKEFLIKAITRFAILLFAVALTLNIKFGISHNLVELILI